MVDSYIDASLDWYLNQVARSIRCLTRGDAVGGRLEAAESVRPFLQASFALHDRRVVSYYKYLLWELRQRSLSRFGLMPEELVEAVAALVITGTLDAQAAILREAERVFRSAGQVRRFDEWETDSWWRRYFGEPGT